MTLSNAERLVLEKLCAGMTPKQIAHSTNRSIRTIWQQMWLCRRRNGAKTTEQLIYMASSLIDPGV